MAGSSDESYTHSSASMRVLANFDGSEYGPEYLVVHRGESVKAGSQPDDQGWTCVVHSNKEGWIPSEYVEQKKMRVLADFDGSEYGPEYLVVHRGEIVEAGSEPDDQGWTCVVQSKKQGWIPSTFKAEIVTGTLGLITGHWADNANGSTYRLTLDMSGASCSVSTTMKNGNIKYTDALITINGSDILWSDKFKLDHGKSELPQELHWQRLPGNRGSQPAQRRKPDSYTWTRILS